MKIIISNSIVQGIFIAVAAGAIMFFAKYLVRVICPIRKSKVFSSFKYDEQMLEDGTYVLEENKEYKEFFCGTVAHCIYRNISSHNIAVNKALVVIDKISSRGYKRVDIICHYANGLMHFYIINNGNERKCGFKTIQNIYDKNNWIKHKEKKETIYRCRFEDILVNAIWNVDIHYCKKMPGLMVYGIIDDKSRFLISLSLLVSKDAKTCANEMKKAIIEYGPVGAIWSDNGEENTGLEFVNMLKEFGIKTVRTNPYSPEQNGKIERLWQSFEKMTTSNPFSTIVFRNNYNNLIPNRALNYKTPLELYTQLSHWKPNLPIEYIVDNNFINEIK